MAQGLHFLTTVSRLYCPAAGLLARSQDLLQAVNHSPLDWLRCLKPRSPALLVLVMDPTENTASNISPVFAWCHCHSREVLIAPWPSNCWRIWRPSVTCYIVGRKQGCGHVTSTEPLHSNRCAYRAIPKQMAVSAAFTVSALGRHVRILFIQMLSVTSLVLTKLYSS
jgi:hypothetical protein